MTHQQCVSFYFLINAVCVSLATHLFLIKELRLLQKGNPSHQNFLKPIFTIKLDTSETTFSQSQEFLI